MISQVDQLWNIDQGGTTQMEIIIARKKNISDNHQYKLTSMLPPIFWMLSSPLNVDGAS